MNAVEKVKQLCKERKIPISKLEKDLGYGNGYIGQLRKGTLPSNRLIEIASYLDVPTSYLAEYDETNTELPKPYYLNSETADMAQKLFDNKDLRLLFDAAQDASPEDLKTTYDMLMALKRKERGED